MKSVIELTSEKDIKNEFIPAFVLCMSYNNNGHDVYKSCFFFVQLRNFSHFSISNQKTTSKMSRNNLNLESFSFHLCAI